MNHALLQFGHNSAVRSDFHDRDLSVMRSASAHHHSLLDQRRQYAKLPSSHVDSPHVQVSVVHPNSSEGISLNAASVQGLDKSSCAPQPPRRSARSKGQNKSESAAAAALELLHQKVSLLESEQASRADATILCKSTAFKSTSFQHLASVLKLLKELLGSGENACRALAANPGFLWHRRSQHLEQKLKVLVDFGIKEEVVRKLCTAPHILTRKVESLHKRLSLFGEIGLTVEAINRLLRTYPRILQYADGNILLALDFFKSLGMSGKEILCTPALLSQPVDSIRKKYDFLRDQGFSDSDVHVLIHRNRQILGVADKNLKSKLDFLLCEHSYDLADIIKYPRCLTYSLQGRLIPRFKALKGKGLSKVYALSTIVSYNDLRFQKLIRRGKGP